MTDLFQNALGRGIGRGFALTGLLFGALFSTDASARLAVGGVEMVIALPGSPAPGELSAARELQDYLEKITGDVFPVIDENDFSEVNTSFFVGATRRSESLEIDWEGLDEDAVAIYSVENGVVLRGGAPHATEFAVYRFLHHFGGVRWYLPGELGEEAPKRTDWVLPEIAMIEEPSFQSRRFSGIRGEEGVLWEKRNLMRGRDRFHHNLHRIFNEALFEEHPEFFPLRNGERARPDDSIGGYNLQICYGNPEAARVAAEAAIRGFDENPEWQSFSLGMFDTDPICECPLCSEWIDPERTFRDKPDYSDLLFTFMNRAAEVVEKTYPDRYVGCLAYHWAENTPSFPVHPNVLPYLTADRPMWIHPEFREEDRALIRRWTQMATRVGIYDYYFGEPYVIPRHFFAVMEESLGYAHAEGVRGFYGQITPVWSLDGPKAWLASQLLWDITQTKAELLDEFYSRFYKRAAHPMRQFFELAERQWKNQGGRPNWLKYYRDISQMELFPPSVCREGRALLDEARELAHDDLSRRRVELVSEGFRRTELLSEIYHGGMNLGRASLVSREKGEAFLAMMGELGKAQEELEELEKEFLRANSPLQFSRRYLEEGFLYHPSGRIQGRVGELLDWGRREGESERVADALELWKRRFPQSSVLLEWEVAEAESDPSGRVSQTVIFSKDWTNPASLFDSREAWWEAIEEGESWPWMRTFRRGTRPGFSMQRREEGGFLLQASGAIEERVYLFIPAEGGVLYQISAFAEGSNSSGSLIHLRLYWHDQNGLLLGDRRALIDQLGEGETVGTERLSISSRAPLEADYGYLLLEVSQQMPEDIISFSRIEMKRVAPEE